MVCKVMEFHGTLTCQIAEQALKNEQVLNSKVLPAPLIFTAYVVPNKQEGWGKRLKIVK